MASKFKVELLCGHHVLDDFDCGHAESNVLARMWHTKLSGTRHWRYADEFVAVTSVDGDRLVGILVIQDLRLTTTDVGDSGALEGNFLFYQLFAVAQDHPVRSRWLIVRDLMGEIDAIRSVRLAREDYVGELAAPSRAAEAVRHKLTVYLKRHGFRPLGSIGDLWYRPKSEPGER